ncbi:hypothetical protein VKT23_010174 [Stygiomarasmius scandens]|uniref:Uncharacterized protein n=1 Tax=Marasmiellus scandens TaxID=2682957 RepID=A0ABR1JEZ9_9AGAR
MSALAHCDTCLQPPSSCQCQRQLPSTPSHSFSQWHSLMPTNYPKSSPLQLQVYPAPYPSQCFPLPLNYPYCFQYPYNQVSPSPQSTPPTHSGSRIVLNDETSHVTNQPGDVALGRTSRKHRGTGQTQTGGCRSCCTEPTTVASTPSNQTGDDNKSSTIPVGQPAVYGVGSITEDANSTPHAFTEGTHFHSII